ncbi:MAG: 3-deoxy-D-manno-octulosonic acid transferase [Hyphomicrobiaceae bacterium]|nr:3-deoxy-D-manno-octulosonic acid transferase [Hyphomicrobiaceae bacterium]
MSGQTLKTGHAGPLPVPATPPSERIELKVYRALTWAALPVAPVILRLRERRGKEDPRRRAERMGRSSLLRPGGQLAWIHAASVGETSAVLPLMLELLQVRPRLELLLTTGTVTSAQFAAGRLPPRSRHQYVPLDSPPLVARFLDHWRPDLAVFTEQEMWPNLIVEPARRGIPLALVNARMSDASFARWQQRAGLAEALFSRFSVVLAQNDALAQRFMRLGAGRTFAVGNLKIDAPAPPIDGTAYAALRAALGDRPRLLAASTHAGEEEIIAEAHLQIAAHLPGLMTIIAPRHPDRGSAVAAAISDRGLTVERRSTGALPGPTTEVYVADTIGELGTLYASTPVAFIGGSLVPHGGQNPIEAVRHGTAVLTGPFTHNFADPFRALTDAGGARVVTNADGLADAVAALLADPDALAQMQAGATRALSSLAGALERTVAALLPLLADPSEVRGRAV